ncbi:FUSC family protein [Nocardia sp. NPDC005746]|uniref:FUSC family protein n=1 Tax=Nocardia sp. NPDC005746 TaxID=3157062 RepID=UPI0033CDD663
MNVRAVQTAREAAAGLFTVGPAAGHTRHALRVAAGLAIPGSALLALGRTDLLIFAMFGSFVGMYGRDGSRRERGRHQRSAALLIGGGVGVGVWLAAAGVEPLVLIVVESGFAAAASLLADHRGIRPAGPFYAIFALGAIAWTPADAAKPLPALAVFTVTAALCMALAALDIESADAAAAPASPGLHVGARHATRYAVAVSGAGLAGLGLGVGHANWAMVSAAVPLAALDAGAHFSRGLHRVAGTFLGLGLTAILLVPGPRPVLTGALVLALLFPTELYMARNYTLALGFFTPLIMLMTSLSVPASPERLLFDRGIDTVLGVAIGVLVATAHRHLRWQTPGIAPHRPQTRCRRDP